MTSRLLFVLLILTTLFACQEDNFDEFKEEALPFEPIEVTIDDVPLTYRLADGGEVAYDEGFGVALKSLDGNTNLYTIASGDITCVGDVDSSSVGLSIEGSGIEFLISWFEFDDGGSSFGYFSAVKTVIDGDTLTVYGPGTLVRPECAAEPLIVNIEEETDEYIRGAYEGEFFDLVIDSTSTGEITCENFRSVGIINAEFFVPLTGCQ